ncbi:microfibril-associated glycoprotein 4-like isoform X4 [Diabrotica virgifera virgifera]|uniref:Fibrinogen C-terminal domain-containing protein n=1 Tax=Diabrotica virgifera virgifera TaxID=50390 RepID=A0ABM5KP05_DIAVI|nr:microfibril-associated glycoprotein 4-like isoform X4 [Diabrotica virgifera virgifera]
MISSIVVLLILVYSSEYVVSEKLSVAAPADVKFTKLLDVKFESRTSSLRNDFGRFLYPQTEDIDLGTKEEYWQVPLKLSFGIDRQNSIQEYEKTILNVFDQCKYLVGRSQIPLCRLNPVEKNSENNHPRSCREILEAGNNKSGVYQIKPRTSSKQFAVLCDMETKGGGWTHIQKRFDGSQDFYLPWRDYKFGFGDLVGEFWIGLENIYHMTAFDRNELLIELTDTDKNTSYAQYSTFSIGCEKDGYPLKELTGYSGNAGDSLTSHINAKFTTLDVDQDKDPGNCAQNHEGAWWYTACFNSNLNGKYMTLVLPGAYLTHGLNWHALKNSYVNLAGSRMMIRPVGE